MAEIQAPPADDQTVSDDQLREDILRGIEVEGVEAPPEPEPEPGSQDGGERRSQGGAQDDAEPPQGQPVPWESFKKRTERWAKQKSEWDGTKQSFEAQIAAYKQGGALSAEDAAKYKQLTALMGNLDNAVAGQPEIAAAILEMLQGKQPNWRTFHDTLGKRLQGLPSDPIAATRLLAMEQNFERLEQARTDDMVNARVAGELPEVRRILGEDENAIQLVLSIGAGIVNSLPEGQATLQNLPSLVEIAKRVDAYGVSREQRRLEALRARGQQAANGAVRVGSGAGPGENRGSRQRQADAPPGTVAFYKQLQGLAYTKEDLEEPA